MRGGGYIGGYAKRAFEFPIPQQGVLAHNGWGAYTIRFSDGSIYIGKGDESRMKQSAKERTTPTRVPIRCKHNKGSSNRDSFIKEDRLIEAAGDIGAGNLLNAINSPGKGYRGR